MFSLTIISLLFYCQPEFFGWMVRKVLGIGTFSYNCFWTGMYLKGHFDSGLTICKSITIQALSRQNSMSMEDILQDECYGTPKPTPMRRPVSSDWSIKASDWSTHPVLGHGPSEVKREGGGGEPGGLSHQDDQTLPTTRGHQVSGNTQ